MSYTVPHLLQHLHSYPQSPQGEQSIQKNAQETHVKPDPMQSPAVIRFPLLPRRFLERLGCGRVNHLGVLLVLLTSLFVVRRRQRLAEQVVEIEMLAVDVICGYESSELAGGQR